MSRVRLLGASDRRLVEQLLDADPVAHCFVASRLEAGVLDPAGPGELWGYPARAPHALLHMGANLVAVNADPAALDAFAEAVGRWRNFVAIVGPAPLALGLQRRLAARWGRPYATPRLVRARQWLMSCTALAPGIDPDPRVAPVGEDHFFPYLDAAVAMYREELEEDPLGSNPLGYRRYVRSLLAEGRAHGIVEDGRVVFKADLGAVSPAVAQIQGVWVAPQRRGQRLSVGGMAAVTRAVLDTGRTASLLVNDFNAPAIASYRRVGYDVVGEFASVLY